MSLCCRRCVRSSAVICSPLVVAHSVGWIVVNVVQTAAEGFGSNCARGLTEVLSLLHFSTLGGKRVCSLVLCLCLCLCAVLF